MDVLTKPYELYDDLMVKAKYSNYCNKIKVLLEHYQKPHDKRYKQNYFIPTRPAKCINIMETNEPQPIIYRSGWEQQFMSWCDKTDSITRWGSEVIKILYPNPITNKMSFYIPDGYVEILEQDKKIHKYLIEIKPLKEAVLSKASNGYDKLMVAKNSFKWQAAIQYCNKRGITFKVLHENNLGLN